ncbi:hypothetical protein FOXG_19001 [Fusarium oxysporum f. sp. lycopersici 4287]|uniref:Uncharacterized protein n=2 Tax=Fusarium oxysporum TaxID=5507 RepID=A0A0J9WKL0_FUSO4|nr:hypothetical protein FOXG_19001 [Fusarium oxysporum f. sp. lycopersici 4287]EXK39151.1 hypothetical protein FOMG_06567 [Fusarium oxysporum f. sp. melonis 26406]KNB02217.1 hypothetical protein FOXG_19001 [Fusarium oxysporum f. sp. lycopersici 4287]
MSQRLVLIVSGIPRAIINFAPGLRRASDETRLTVPRPSPRCPPTFGLVFGFYFFSPSMTTIDCQQLSYESSNNTTTISVTFCAFSTPPLTTSHTFTNSYLSSFASASSFLSSFV